MDLRSTAIPLPLAPGRPDGRLPHGTRPWPTDGSRRLRPGEILLAEGQPPDSLMIVQLGAILLTVTAPGGRSAAIGVLGRGDVLGEEALARLLTADGPAWLRPEVRALVASTVSTCSPHGLGVALSGEPAVPAWIVDGLGRRACQLQSRLSWSLSLGVPDHLLAVLRDMATRWGVPAPGGVAVGLPLSQETLASMVGASRETVNRALGRLIDAGVIRRHGRRYVLVGPPAPAPRGPGRGP